MSQNKDPLEYLPLERWSELQSAFKADWPRGVSGYAALEIQRRWKEQGIDYEFKVYCPYGDVTNGMVAVNVKDEFYEIIILCPKDDTQKLEEAIRKTKIIDWNKEVCVPFAPHNVIKCLQKALPDINVDITKIFHLDTFILENEIHEDVSLPPNVTFGLVTVKDLELVDSTWPHRYPTSPWYFQLLSNANYGYGLYVDNALISWVFIRESGALNHLYTVEEYRRQGYAELLLKLISKIWPKEGIPLIAYCFLENVNASKLYRKMDFVRTEPIGWCYCNKNVK